MYWDRINGPHTRGEAQQELASLLLSILPWPNDSRFTEGAVIDALLLALDTIVVTDEQKSAFEEALDEMFEPEDEDE